MFPRFFKFNIAIIAGLVAGTAFAQSSPRPQIIITWRAESFVSSSYQGKIFPTGGTPILLAATLVDGGRVIDLSKKEVRWFKDGKFFAGGVTARFAGDAFGATSHRIKAVVPDYKGGVEAFIVIPLAQPEISIKVPKTGFNLSPGTYNISALFYFWNVLSKSQIAVQWQTNGASAAGEGDSSKLSLVIPKITSPLPLSLLVSASNSKNDLEFASAAIDLTMTPSNLR